MSKDPAELVDAVRLAASGAVHERRYRLAEFPRLADFLAGPEGEATVRLQWLEVDGMPACHLALQAAPLLTCQRCRQPVTQRLASDVRLVFTGAAEVPVPQDFEALQIDPARLDLLTLVEDELLLSLPVLSLHGDGHPCGAAAAQTAPVAVPPADTQRPFAGLKDLLKH